MHRARVLAAMLVIAGVNAVVIAAGIGSLRPVGVVADAGCTVATPSPSASPTPTPAPGSECMAVTPATHLVNGQFVLVQFSGVPTDGSDAVGISFRECVANPANPAEVKPNATITDCTFKFGISASADPVTGSGSLYLSVQSSVDGIEAGNPLPAGQTSPTIVCDSFHPCVLAAVLDNNDLNGAFYAQLTFDPSSDNCPQHANDVLGSGSSTAYRAIYRWEGVECLPPDSIKVGYTGGAEDDFLQPFFQNVASPDNAVSYGVTGPVAQMPTSPDPQSGTTFKYAPLTESGLVLAYLMFDPNTGQQITSLVLTPDLIASTMLGDINNFYSNQAVQALNPNETLPARIQAYYRADSGSVNYIMSSWLAANAPKTWVVTTGTGSSAITKPLVPSIYYPLDAAGLSVQGITGANALGLKMTTAVSNDNSLGALAFMDSSVASYFGLPTVKIQMPNNPTPVAATPASIAKAIGDDMVNPDGTVAINWHNSDPAAWPLSTVTYVVAPTNKINPSLGAVVAKFLRYAVQGGQQNLAPGYAPLPAALVKESLTVAGDIPVPAVATPAPSFSAVLPLTTTTTGVPPAHVAPTTITITKTPSPAKGSTRPGKTVPPPKGQLFGALGDWANSSVFVPSLGLAGLVALVIGVALALVSRRHGGRSVP